MATIKRNFLFNLLLTGFNALLPLVTYPYVTRVLGPGNFGLVSVFNSISDWLLFALTLGIPSYGMREIARYRDNPEESSRVFSELILIQWLSAIFFSAVYGLIFVYSAKVNAYPSLFICSLLPVLTSFLATDWLFGGFELYGLIAKRTIGIKIAYLISIFIFVRSSSDYVAYALLSALVLVLSNVVSIIYCRKLVTIRFTRLNLMRHVKPLLILWSSYLIGSIYAKGDIVLLGYLSTNESVGYFAVEKRITLTLLTISGALSTVVIPRLANLVGKGQEQEASSLIGKSMELILLLSLFITAYLMLFSTEIIDVLCGAKFVSAGSGLFYIAPLIVVSNISGIIGLQVLLPRGKERVILVMACVAALVNLSINLIFVPHYQHLASSIAIVFSESAGVLFGLYYLKRHLHVALFNKPSALFICISLIASLGTWGLLRTLSIPSPLLALSVGGCVYTLLWVFFLSIIKPPALIALIRKRS